MENQLSSQNSNTTRYFLFMGILASIIVGMGEYLLHFMPEGPSGEITMLESVPLERASKGHFLSILGTPLYFAGYYGLYKTFIRTNKKLATLFFTLGILAFFIGGIWISSRYFGAEVLQRSMGTEDYSFYLDSYDRHYQSLVWALRIIIAVLSIVYVILILQNKNGIPKWLAIFNPIIILGIVISSLFWFKPLGVHIAPIAMNVTHLILFGLIIIYTNSSLQISQEK